MMKRFFYLMVSLILPVALCMVSCKKDKIEMHDSSTTGNQEPQGDGIIRNAVKDYDGNTYDAVKLGNQVWMASNLRTSHYADGTEIVRGSSMSYSKPYYYKPENADPSFGYFYNWKAAVRGAQSSESNPSGVQGVCPNGWHMPSDAEWDELATYCRSKSEYVCSSNMYVTKALAADHGWETSDLECAPGYDQSTNNTTGFNAQAEGFFSHVNGNYSAKGIYTTFWGSTGCDGCTYAYSHSFTNAGRNLGRSQAEKNEGCSVRCVRD